MLGWNSQAHGNRAQHVSSSVDGHDDEETETDPAQRRKDWLETDRAQQINQEQSAQHEGNCLGPEHRPLAARCFHHGLGISSFN